MGKLVPVVMVSPACGESTVTGVARGMIIALDPRAADSTPIVASLGILHSILKEYIATDERGRDRIVTLTV
jgi:hypothetical protein